MSRITAFCEWLLRQAVVWGCLACFAFYVLVVKNQDRSGALYRSFAGANQGVKLAVAVLFFTAAASLAIKLFGLVVQFGALSGVTLAAAPLEGHTADDVQRLQTHLAAAPKSVQNSFLGRRLDKALKFVAHRGSGDGLEAHLIRLDETDARNLAQRYAGTRLTAAAIVILGALGAVIGLSTGLAKLPPGADGAGPTALAVVCVALEPLVQSLVLCIALAGAKFAVERTEHRLLAAVGDSASRQLLGRFRQYGNDADPHLASIKRMCEKTFESIEGATARHDAALSRAIGAAGRRWEESAAAASTAIHRALGDSLSAGLKEHSAALNEGVAKHTAGLEGTLVRHAQILSDNIDHHTAALADALEHHAAVVTETEKSLSAQNQQHLAEMEASLGESMLLAATRQEKLIQQSEDVLRELQIALVEAAGTTVAQQEQLVKQSDVLLRVVEATGQIQKLEQTLNHNLSSLAASHDFEQTASTLAAAVQLLASRLRQPLHLRDDVDLRGGDSTSHAA